MPTDTATITWPGMPYGERNWREFAARYPAEAAWLQSAAAGAFGASLIKGCRRYGGLTMRQMAAVQRNLAPSGTPIASAQPAVPSGQISGAGGDVPPVEGAPFFNSLAAIVPAAPIVGTTPEGVPVTFDDVRHGAQVTLSSMVDVIRAERDAVRSEAIAANRAPVITTIAEPHDDIGRAVNHYAARAGATVAPSMSSVANAAYRALTDNQIAPPPALVTIAADPVRRAMDSAAASGLRKVKLSLGNVTFKLSGPRFIHGRGMILCYHDGSYKGWIDRENAFHPSRMYEASNSIMDGQTGGNAIDAFRTAAADPQAAARTHGMDTGYCSCCRRLLTDPPSVMAGIGPICIRRFGWSR